MIKLEIYVTIFAKYNPRSLVDVSQQTTTVHDFSACFQGVPYKNVNEAGMTAGFTATNNIKLFYANEDTPTHLNYQLIHHKTRS